MDDDGTLFLLGFTVISDEEFIKESTCSGRSPATNDGVTPRAR